MKKTTKFRELINSEKITIMPGVQDALTACIAEKTGFEVITCGGYSSTAALLGQPDTSQLTMTEMAEHYARICDSVDIPVFGDGDTGFGNVTNVSRTVKRYEASGLAGMFIEDQVFPKRCGHMPGKQVVSTQEMVAKLQSALDARQDPDFVIMARTDALAIYGIEQAIERMSIYREVGADLLFVEAPENEAQMKKICSELDGPCLANNIEAGATPVLNALQLEEIGYALMTHPLAVTYAITHAVTSLMETIKRDGTTDAFINRLTTFDDFNEIVGLTALREREQALLDKAQKKVQKNN